MEEGSILRCLVGSEYFCHRSLVRTCLTSTRFERELEALRKELAISEALRSSSNAGSTPAMSDDDSSPAYSPLMLPKRLDLEPEEHVKTE
jgi:hypothetical protein